jgi:hypothetical protein
MDNFCYKNHLGILRKLTLLSGDIYSSSMSLAEHGPFLISPNFIVVGKNFCALLTDADEHL